MNAIFYLGLILIASVWLLSKFRWQALYVLTFFAYVQNFALAYLYTHHLAGRDLLWSALLAKEILLLVAFFYAIRILARYFPWVIPKPLLVLLIFTVYCVGRIMIGISFLNDNVSDSLRMLRMTFYPLEIFSVALAATLTQPKFSDRYLKKVCYFIGILALAGIYLAFFSGKNFWAENVNIATYNIDIKGDDPFYVSEEQGVSGTALGREQFLDLIPFRAMSTFGDPLAMGFAVVPAILLFMFYFEQTWHTRLFAGILIAGLLLTFSRSAWILLFVVCLFVLVKERRFVWLAMALLVPLIAVISVGRVAEFALEDFARLSWANPGGEHAEGIIWFYRQGFTDLGNVFGKGMSPDVQKIPESGYAFLLEHLGVFAYISFVWFLFSLFRWLGQNAKDRRNLVLVSQGILLGMFVVMHFSQYPFAFIEWLMLWFLLGANMAFVWRGKLAASRGPGIRQPNLAGAGTQSRRLLATEDAP